MTQQFSKFVPSWLLKSLGILGFSYGIITFGIYPAAAQDSQNPNNTSGPVPVDASTTSTSTPPPNSTSTPSTTTSSPSSTTPSVLTGQRFSCQFQNGQYTVMYQPKSQPGQYFPWASPSAMGDGWSPERRCNEISRRLEVYRPDGLVEMRTGMENGYNTICATTEKNSACRIVLTVPVGQDPTNLRDRVFGNLTTADSGQQTTAVPTFVEGRRSSILGNLDLGGLLGGLNRTTGNTGNTGIVPPNFSGNGIYLKPYLDPADGGTGTALRNSYSFNNGRRLNPGNFR